VKTTGRDFHLLLYAIERYDSFEKHPDRVASRIVHLTSFQHRFKPASRAVTEITDCASAKGRQPAAARQLLTGKSIGRRNSIPF
jgi:hypothetical protein